jgi:hypothetical protein
MNKVIRDGKVAVLYSPGFGAGWYSWNSEHEWLLYDPETVAMVEAERNSEIADNIEARFPGLNIYCGGARDLTIAWLPVGTRFRIHEYDGSEHVVDMGKEEHHIA